MGLIRLVGSALSRLLSSAAADRIEDKFEKVHDKLERFDERMDHLERSQAEQNQKLSAIHEISLANNESLEQKLNSARTTSEAINTIMEVRSKTSDESFKRLENLVLQVINQRSDQR